MEELKLPKDANLAGKVIEGHYQREQSKIDRGYIGGIFGTRDSVPANVAAVIALVAAGFLIIFSVRWAGNDSFSYKDAVTGLSGLITLTVGYLFGRSSKD